MLPLFKSKVHRGCYCLHALAALLNVVYKSNRREGGRHLKLCEIKKIISKYYCFHYVTGAAKRCRYFCSAIS